MKRQLGRTLGFAIIAAFIMAVGGCASTTELANVKQQLQEAMDTAEQANSRADNAAADAADAMAVAQEAKNIAEDSAACCTATNEKMNRMFNQVQQK